MTQLSLAFERLICLVRTLRGDGGCPWDRVQTADKIVGYLMEEAYEVWAAIESANPSEIRQELGDLIFQIVFLASIHEESANFDIEDVINGVCEKMIRRHPHVFANAQATTAEDVRKQWHEIKISEAKKENQAASSVLNSVPDKLPALMWASRIGERCAGIGFEWPDSEGIFQRVNKALAEYHNAAMGGQIEQASEKLGDALFDLANLSRMNGIGAEAALRQTVKKIINTVQKNEEQTSPS